MPVFGPLEGGETTLISAGLDDIFVARFNPDGTLAWAKSVGDVNGDRGHCVAALTDGSVVVTGEFEDTAVFGPLEPGETTLVSAGSDDIFVARYNLDGTLAWAKGMGASGSDYGFGITARPDNSTVVTGEFTYTTIFGLGDAAQTSLTSAGSDDVFIACYSPDGTLAWAKRAGGTGEDEGHGIAAQGYALDSRRHNLWCWCSQS